MERGYVPSRWDSPPGSSSSQGNADRGASKRTVPGSMDESVYDTHTVGENERRKKLTQAYGRSLLSALHSTTLPPSSTSMNPTLIIPSVRIPPPSVKPRPSSRQTPLPKDDSSQRNNPFPIELGRKRDERPNVPQVLVQSSADSSIPAHKVGSSTPIFPASNLNADAIQQIMLAGINALAKNNPSLQTQLILGQNNSANNLLGVNVKSSAPDGSGLLKYRAPDTSSFVFDRQAGYKFDPTTGLHYDANSGLFINLDLKIFLRWDSILSTYLRVDLPGQGSGVGPISQNSEPVISQLSSSTSPTTSVLPTGIPVSFLPADVVQSQAASVLLGGHPPSNPVNPSSSIPPNQDSFMNEIWQRMRTLAKDVLSESQVTKIADEASDVRNAKVRGEASGSGNPDGQRQGRRKHSLTSRSRSSSSEDRRKKRDKSSASTTTTSSSSSSSSSTSTSTSRSRSHSRGSVDRRKRRKRSRRGRSRGRSTVSRSPGRKRRRSRSSRARRSRSRRRSIDRRGRRSRSRGRRSRSRGARRTRSRSRNRGWRSIHHRDRSGSRNRRSRSRGGRRNHSRGRRSLHPRLMEVEIPKPIKTLAKRKAEERNRLSPRLSPKRQHFISSNDHKTGKEYTSKGASGETEKEKPKTKDEETNQGDSDDLSDFDFLKETLDDDNESVIVDEHEEKLEHDESIFKDKSPATQIGQTVDIGDILGHLFPNDQDTSTDIILVAPVPLRDDLRNSKCLRNHMGDREDVVKIHVFSKSTGSPCHYMLIFFITPEAAVQWYNSNNGAIILNGDDSSKMKGYLHFVGSGNWNCYYCNSPNFLMRTLCHHCYQAKDFGYSPVSVVKFPTKWVGISKLKSCFPTAESVVKSLPSLHKFDIQNIQMIAEPRKLPMGLCVFEVQNEEEAIRLYGFFRQQGRASNYLIMNKEPNESNAEENTNKTCEQAPDCNDANSSQLTDGGCDESHSLALLFTNEMPKNILLVAPIPLSKTPKKSELSAAESSIQKALEDDGVKYTNITLHIDKHVGAPCSYGLIAFADSETAAKWRQQHDGSLNISMTGSQFPTSGDTEPSSKVSLHFGENNWECQNCLTLNFFLRSMCHNCFFLRDGNALGPIKKSPVTSKWVATSKLTEWFTSNESIATELKKLMKDLKLTKIDVLRDPKIPVFPLGCVFETESLGESLRLREFLQRTKRFSWFVTLNKGFREFTCTDNIPKYRQIIADNTPQTTVTRSESAPAVVNDPRSINTPSEDTVNQQSWPGGTKPLTLTTEACDLSGSDADRTIATRSGESPPPASFSNAGSTNTPSQEDGVGAEPLTVVPETSDLSNTNGNNIPQATLTGGGQNTAAVVSDPGSVNTPSEDTGLGTEPLTLAMEASDLSGADEANIPQTMATENGESTPAVASDPGSITSSEATGLGAKPSSAVTETSPNTDIGELEPDQACKDYLLWWSQDSVRYSDILNDLFVHNPLTRVPPEQTIFVGPLSNSLNFTEDDITASALQKTLSDILEQGNIPFSTISIHAGSLCGAPCSYGLVRFNNSQHAEAWHDKHKGGLILPRPEPVSPASGENASFKTYVYHCKPNWNCTICRWLNFGLRSFCHNCFGSKEPGKPNITLSSSPTGVDPNFVCIRRFKSYTVSEERLVANYPFLKNLKKLFNFKVLKEKSGIPLGTCLLATKNSSDAQQLYSNLAATEKRHYIRYGNSGSVPEGLLVIGNSENAMECGGEFEEILNDESPSEILSSENTGLGANKPLTGVSGTVDLSSMEIEEPKPDDSWKSYMLWWGQDLIKYSDLLNCLFLQNPLTRVSPGHILFVGPLPSSFICTGNTAAALQKIIADKLAQDNVPFSVVGIHAGPLFGAPCTYGLVRFRNSQDAEAWHDKHKGGLILPRPQLFQKLIQEFYSPASRENRFFKTFVYFCPSNWHCRGCQKFNFGLRSNCFNCTASKDSGKPFVSFSKKPTIYVSIRNFKSHAATEERLFAHCRFLRDQNIPFFFKTLKETSDIPLGMCILQTNNVNDATRLFNYIRGRGEGQVRYAIFHQTSPEPVISSSGSAIECEDEFKDFFSDGCASKVLYFGPIPGNIANAEQHYRALIVKDGAHPKKKVLRKVECCLGGTFGAPHNYCLVHFSAVQFSTAWYKKCQGRVTLTQKALPDGKFVAMKPVNAFLHFTEDNWSCDCGKQNFPLRSVCFSCYKERGAVSPRFIMSCTPKKWLLVRLNQRYATDEQALGLHVKKYSQAVRIVSVKHYSDPKIPKDSFGYYIIEVKSAEEAVLLRRFYQSKPVLKTRSTDYVELNNLEPGTTRVLGTDVTSQVMNFILPPKPIKSFLKPTSSGGSRIVGPNVTSQVMNLSPIPKPQPFSQAGSSVGVAPAIEPRKTMKKYKELLVCPDHTTILWTSLYESRLNNPPTNVVMISLCPGDRQLPHEARTQIQNSLQAAGNNHQSIEFSFKGVVGSPFSYCLVSFDTMELAKTWMDKCSGTFRFDVPCPDDMKPPFNFQNCYSRQSSNEFITSIKSKLHYSLPNWQCSCGSWNFPLRSLCHNCFKNKAKESDYESITDASCFVGIKLTDFIKSLIDSNPACELREAGLEISKTAICYDPTLPRDPCGVVIFEAQSVEFGTKLYNFLNEKNSQDRKGQSCKAVMRLLGKSSGITYLKCPKSLEPNWPSGVSENWETYFVNETVTNTIVVNIDLPRTFKIDIPLEQYGGKVKPYRYRVGFNPGLLGIHFLTPQAAKEFYNASNGKLKHPITSALHSLHFTNFWKCSQCSCTNFPARVFCQRCYHNKTGGFSPLKMVTKPTIRVGINKDANQKQVMLFLVNNFRKENDNFQLRSLEIFFDPIVRQDGSCIFVFKVSSTIEGVQLKNFFEKRNMKCFFFKMNPKQAIHFQQSQLQADPDSTTGHNYSQGQVSEETGNTSKVKFSDDIFSSDQSDVESKASSIIHKVVDCIGDSKPANSPANIEAVPIKRGEVTAIHEDEGSTSHDSFMDYDLPAPTSAACGTEIECIESQNDEKPVVGSVYHPESSNERVEEELGSKSVSGENNELSMDSHEQKTVSLDTEPHSQKYQSLSEPGALEEVQASSKAEDGSALDVCATSNKLCHDSESGNVESIHMETSELKELPEDQSSSIADVDTAVPTNSSQCSYDQEATQTNPRPARELVPVDRNKLQYDRNDDDLEDMSADDAGLVDSTRNSSMDTATKTPNSLSEPSSIQKTEAEVHHALEEFATTIESCLISDFQNVDSVPMDTSEPETLQDDQASSKSEEAPISQVCASPRGSYLDTESMDVESISVDTSEPKTLQDDQASSKSELNSQVCASPRRPYLNSGSKTLESIPMDTSESKALLEDQTSTTVDGGRASSSQGGDDQKIPQTHLEQTGELIDDDGGDPDLKDLSGDEAGQVDQNSGPSWIPPHEASEFVVVAPLTPKPSVNSNKDLRDQISKILTNGHADFKDVIVHRSLESGAPWHYSVVHFASAESAKTWLETRGRQMKLKRGARVKKQSTVHLYFGQDDWVCACGIANYFERTFCHGCFMLKTGADFSTIKQSTIPTLWVAVRACNPAKNVDTYLKSWMQNLRKSGLTFVTEPTFHSDPGIKAGDIHGVCIFKNPTLEESEKLLTWFSAKHRAMYVAPYVSSPSK